MHQLLVEEVSKLYRIQLEEERSQDLTVRLGRALLAPVRNLGQLRSLDRFANESDASVLWALREISFAVEPGEVIGVIGRNGAGKSTLLKILSRITRPTKGRVTIRGRLSSLLEVGTGFHPELTGRENIFLNGAIIGMRTAEIRRKMDAIVDFSGVERFLDTPIKRYSSGMKVRLAFAVAAHLEPDILIIDEVLAVGDTEFQQKCLGAMASIGRSGRTVLFVSHNLAAVQSLCRRGIVLERGTMRFDGPVGDALESYLATLGRGAAAADGDALAGAESNGLILRQLDIRGEDGRPDGDLVRSGCPFTIAAEITGAVTAPSPILNVVLSGAFGERLLLLSSRLAGLTLQPFTRRLRFHVHVPQLMIMPGSYRLDLTLYTSSGEAIASWEQVRSVEVHPDPAAPPLTLPSPSDRGVVYAPAEWEICTEDA